MVRRRRSSGAGRTQAVVATPQREGCVGRPPGSMAAATGRPPMRSPGRPPPHRDVQRQFWRRIAEGMSSEDAAAACGVSPSVGSRWFRHGGGMPPMSLEVTSGRCLCFAEREEISLLHAQNVGGAADRAGIAPIAPPSGVKVHPGKVPSQKSAARVGTVRLLSAGRRSVSRTLAAGDRSATASYTGAGADASARSCWIRVSCCPRRSFAALLRRRARRRGRRTPGTPPGRPRPGTRQRLLAAPSPCACDRQLPSSRRPGRDRCLQGLGDGALRRQHQWRRS
jgi:hypothetical protein